MPHPFSLIIDDGSPVNPMFYALPDRPTPFIIPNGFARRFGDICLRHGVYGKFSVIPMPSRLGRIDQQLNHVSRAHLAGFLKAVRERIAPRFDITPEILTHATACNIKTGGWTRIYEDAWVAQASVAEMTDYFALAFRILKNVGLDANGMTSPWNTGITNERAYAHAIGNAQRRVHRRNHTWYFLHSVGRKAPMHCHFGFRDKARGREVISVPANCRDPFWDAMELDGRAARVRALKRGIDELLSPDGKTGRLRDLVDGGYPATLLAHWQSLFIHGTGLGLEALDTLLARINKVFGSEARWTTCSTIAREFAR